MGRETFVRLSNPRLPSEGADLRDRHFGELSEGPMNAARWLALALLCAACSDRSGARSQVTAPPREMNGSGTGDHEDLDPLDPLFGPGRDVRRLSIDQVSASFATVLGQPWTVNTPDGYRYPIEVVYGALGQPDYLRRLSED